MSSNPVPSLDLTPQGQRALALYRAADLLRQAVHVLENLECWATARQVQAVQQDVWVHYLKVGEHE